MQYRAARVQARPRKKNRKLYIMVKLLIFLVSYPHKVAEKIAAGKSAFHWVVGHCGVILRQASIVSPGQDQRVQPHRQNLPFLV